MGEPPPFDPCECIFSPAGAMRRLISLLRQSQNYCTDEQCFQNPQQGLENSSNDGNMTMFMMFVAWMVIAATLYFFRPATIKDGSSKPVHDNDDDHPHDTDPRRQPPPVM